MLLRHSSYSSNAYLVTNNSHGNSLVSGRLFIVTGFFFWLQAYCDNFWNNATNYNVPNIVLVFQIFCFHVKSVSLVQDFFFFFFDKLIFKLIRLDFTWHSWPVASSPPPWGLCILREMLSVESPGVRGLCLTMQPFPSGAQGRAPAGAGRASVRAREWAEEACRSQRPRQLPGVLRDRRRSHGTPTLKLRPRTIFTCRSCLDSFQSF